MKNKAKINYFLDLIIGVFFLVVAFTGLVLKFAFEENIRQGGYQTFGGINKHLWGNWHDIAGILMIVGVLFHLILHWNWLVCMTISFFQKNECNIEK